MKNITTIILAAGKSKRFNSKKSKVFHEIADRSLIDYVFTWSMPKYSAIEKQIKAAFNLVFENNRTQIYKRKSLVD